MVAELSSEVLDVETPLSGDRDSVPHLMQAEAGLDLVLQRDYVVLTGLHGPAAARALENHGRLIGHVHDVIPLPSDPASGVLEGVGHRNGPVAVGYAATRGQQNAPSGGFLVRQPD